ncbi:cysteine desulfurase [Caldiplasma sukawensis]
MLKTEEIKQHFPIFEKFEKEGIIYLDSAATAQKPKEVIEEIERFYTDYCSNVHRGVYRIGEIATDKYNKAREKVSRFINASSESEIIFTRNTTEAINLMANITTEKMGRDDEVLISSMEHHSNIVPWQILQSKGRCRIKILEKKHDQIIRADDILNNINEKTRIVSLTHVSNIFGSINDLNEVGNELHDRGILFMVDGAQSVPHMPVNVRKINCDFLAFSGHKMCGPSGIGVLYGKRELLEELPPYMGGGEMIREVYDDHFTAADIPEKYEAGTPNIEGAIGLGAAVDFLSKIGMDNIREHEKEIVRYFIKRLDELRENSLEVYGPRDSEIKGAVFTFTIGRKGEREIHPHDISYMMDKISGIEIRSGHHCAMPATIRLGKYATARASFYIYNDRNDVDKLFETIEDMKVRVRI